jgi:steroid 5-alpha reductase family enzyme
MKEKWGVLNMELMNLFFIAPVQNVIIFLMASPLSFTNYIDSTSRALSALDYTAATLFLSFLFIEAVADEQQYYFQTAKHALLEYVPRDQLKGDYKLGFLWNSGLFQYSRHPNFFAEQAMWWVVYLFSVAAVQEASGFTDPRTYFNWTFASPIILTILFQGSTGFTEVNKSWTLDDTVAN